MKINEVERLVGIAKVNIRFYEKEGLLTPGRDSGNGYRDYSQADVEWLKKIKLLRMLDVPIEEILRLKAGALTLEDAMGRHLIQLERRQKNLAAMQSVCAGLRDSRRTLDTLDADETLRRMEQQEQEGTRFMDVKKRDKRTKYVGPLIAAVVFAAVMGAVIALMVWAWATDPANSPPLALVIVLIAFPSACIIGVAAALYQRFKQIKGGEEDAAAQY